MLDNREAHDRRPGVALLGLALAAAGCGAAVAGEREEVPVATEFTVRLAETLNSDRHGAGNEFLATVRDDVTGGDGVVLIPAGSEVRGHIVEFGEDPPTLRLSFDRIDVRGEGHDLDAELVAVTPREHSEMVDEGAKIGGGAAVGAVLGAVIGGGAKEAVIGAAAGAAAGTGVALATKDTHAYLPAGSVMRLRLDRPLEVILPEEGGPADEEDPSS